MEDGHTTFMKAGLGICLLALIEARPSYGYELVRELKERGLPMVNERSVYPLLRRLERSGLTESYLAASAAGPARRYYRLLPAGEAHLRERSGAFLAFAETVRNLLDGGRRARG